MASSSGDKGRHLQKMTTKTFSRRKKLKARPRKKRWKKIKVHGRAP
jgi:hypothetical protein